MWGLGFVLKIGIISINLFEIFE